jgi:hypothetical protein
MALRAPAAPLAVPDDIMAGVATLVSTGPVCARCLAFRLGQSRGEIYEVLQRIAGAVALSTDIDRCGRCLREAVVHRVE